MVVGNSMGYCTGWTDGITAGLVESIGTVFAGLLSGFASWL
jgi:hypothetical protein